MAVRAAGVQHLVPGDAHVIGDIDLPVAGGGVGPIGVGGRDAEGAQVLVLVLREALLGPHGRNPASARFGVAVQAGEAHKHPVPVGGIGLQRHDPGVVAPALAAGGVRPRRDVAGLVPLDDHQVAGVDREQPVVGAVRRDNVPVVPADDLLKLQVLVVLAVEEVAAGLVPLILRARRDQIRVVGRGVRRVVLADPQPIQRQVLDRRQIVRRAVEPAVRGDEPEFLSAGVMDRLDALDVRVQAIPGAVVVGAPVVHLGEAVAAVAGVEELHAAVGKEVLVFHRGLQHVPVLDVGVPRGDGLLPGPGLPGVVAAVHLVAAAAGHDAPQTRGARLRARQLALAPAAGDGSPRLPGIPQIIAEVQRAAGQQVQPRRAVAGHPDIARIGSQIADLLDALALIHRAVQEVVVAAGAPVPRLQHEEQRLLPVGGDRHAPHADRIGGDTGGDIPGLPVVVGGVDEPVVGGHHQDVRIRVGGRGQGAQPVDTAVQVVADGLPVGAVDRAAPQAAPRGPRVQDILIEAEDADVGATRLVLAAALGPAARRGHAQVPQAVAARLGQQAVSPLDLLPVRARCCAVHLLEPRLAPGLLLGLVIEIQEQDLGRQRLEVPHQAARQQRHLARRKAAHNQPSGAAQGQGQGRTQRQPIRTGHHRLLEIMDEGRCVGCDPGSRG